jgi:hypothetical protein
MPNNFSEIVVEERYRTTQNYLEILFLVVFCTPFCSLFGFCIWYGLDRVAWQLYFLYMPLWLLGLLALVQLIILGLAIIRDTHGELRASDKQLSLKTAYYNKVFLLRDITCVEDEVKKLGRLTQLGVVIIRVGYKGYSFFPYQLSGDQIDELIELINKLVQAAKREPKMNNEPGSPVRH